VKEVRITFAELVATYWDEFCVRQYLRIRGIDPNGVLIKDISYRDNAVIYRQPETEDDYKDLGIF
jgi:hypothetical protein